MAIRHGICIECGSQTVSKVRGKVPSRCIDCTAERAAIQNKWKPVPRKPRDCPICGAQFTKDNRIRYCSDDCKAEARRSAARAAARKRQPVLPREWTCEHCGEQTLSTRPRRFCSRRCEYTHRHKTNPRRCEIPDCDAPYYGSGMCRPHYRKAHPDKPRPLRTETVQCIICHTAYTRRYSGAKKSAERLPCCSSQCRAVVTYGWRTELPDDHPARWYGRSMAVGFGNCKACQRLFAHDARWPRTYCVSHSWKDSQQRAPRFTSAQCVRCGEWFVGDRQQFYNLGGGLRPHCSPACSAGAGKERRRARKRDAYVADVNRRQVYESDGWRCHICGKKVRRTATVPDPMAPTIDHVIPLADGGTHEPANCRTAHFMCNARKSDGGGGEQMLLIAV